MRALRRALRIAVLPLLLPALAIAQVGATRQLADWETPEDRAITEQPMYQSFHPDHRWRQAGLRAQAAGHYRAARKSYRRSAAYADKAAQAHYALLLWTGQGGGKDRGLALAWMELAAERQYPKFVALRDRFREQVTDAEAVRAEDVRGAVFAAYADAVAKPQLEKVMHRGLLSRTGSRTGGGTSRVQTFASLDDARAALGVGGGGASTRSEFTEFWDAQYWQAARYWDWQDANWEAPGHRGSVTVKPLVTSSAAESPSRPESGDPVK